MNNWIQSKTVRLKTENFTLRSLNETDATDRYLSWLTDPQVNQYLEVRFQESSIETIRQFILGHDNRTSFLLGIFTKSENSHIGTYSIRCDPNHATAAMGHMIGDREYWGSQVVIETRAAILDFLFDDVGIVKVTGKPYSDNAAAIYNFKVQGFTAEGILKSQHISGGRRVDGILFGMQKEEWITRRIQSK